MKGNIVKLVMKGFAACYFAVVCLISTVQVILARTFLEIGTYLPLALLFSAFFLFTIIWMLDDFNGK
jgi:hypothetical protein